MTNEDLKIHMRQLILQRLGAKVGSQDRKFLTSWLKHMATDSAVEIYITFA